MVAASDKKSAVKGSSAIHLAGILNCDTGTVVGHLDQSGGSDGSSQNPIGF